MSQITMRFAGRRVSAAACLMLMLAASLPAAALAKSPDPNNARELVQAALDGMGGADKLRAVKSVRLDAIGHTNLLEQSERPEGPYLISYAQFSEWQDLENHRLRRVSQERSAGTGTPDWSPATLVVADGVAAREANGHLLPNSYAQVVEAEEAFALGPERALFTALDAADLRVEHDTTMQGQPQHVVAFTWQKAPARIYLNAYTHLPTAVELVRAYPYDVFWNVWGDVTTRTYYSTWTLEPGGLRLPYQLDVERNSLPYKSITISTLALNPKLEDASFAISDDVKKAFETRGKRRIADIQLGLPNQQPKELAKDIIQILGFWNVTMIRQSDGIVVLEAPISSAYSAKMIAEVEKRYPGVPIKAVISTSDSWPHLGGLREYVAHGTPAYLLDLNQPIIQRLIAARHTSDPDALAAKPRRADFHVVASKTVIGTGANRLEIYPIRTETGERMMMVYWPDHHLLYGSDLVQPMPTGGFFMPEYLTELMGAAAREHLDVQTVFAMHSGPVTWNDLTAAVTKATTPQS